MCFLLLQAYEARIHGVEALCDQLEKENFHMKDAIKEKALQISRQWSELLELLKMRNSRLDKHLHLHKIFQEMIYIIDWMDGVKVFI